MALISIPYTFTVGATIIAAQHNSNFSTIYNDYNGNITTANLSSSAGIVDSQLAQITTTGKVSGASFTLLPNITSGAGLIPVANIPTLASISPYIKVSETQTSGTAGGTATSGSWITRVINTEDTDTGSIASISSNQVTLPAGNYLVRASSPFYVTSQSQIRLQNITASSTLLTGQVASSASNTTTVFSLLSGYFTLVVSSALEIQYQVASTQATNGLGLAGSFGTEVYTVAEFYKIG